MNSLDKIGHFIGAKQRKDNNYRVSSQRMKSKMEMLHNILLRDIFGNKYSF